MADPADRDDEYDERDGRFSAGLFYGLGKPGGRRRPMGQPAADQIRELMMQSLPPAMEEGVARIGKRYETVGTLVVGSLILTAVATTAIAVMMILDRSK